nr:MAG TPA: hypothetical protein [Caudoviricetes sp.]
MIYLVKKSWITFQPKINVIGLPNRQYNVRFSGECFTK